MSKIYTLTENIHNKLKRLNVEVESDFFWETENNTIFIPEDLKDNKGCICPVLEEPQIKQILIALQEVLGENPKYLRLEKYQNFPSQYDDNAEYITNAINGGMLLPPKTQAEALYQKWCCGFPKSQFETDPESVSEELWQILKSI